MTQDIKPNVSVIVAVYNAEKYLRQCMDSIVSQSLRDIEIICVNDGSTDSSLSILNEYADRDSRVKIYTKNNEGLGGASARNYGLERASGEYVSILDSDDFFEHEMLEKAYNRAKKTDADFVIFGGDEFDNISKKYNKVDSILNTKVIPEDEVFSFHDCPNTIFQLTQGMAWNKLYLKSYLDKTGLRFQRIKYTDDAYFTFANLIYADKMTVLNENLCHYRVNSGINQTSGLANYPDSSYVPYLELKTKFEEMGVFEEIEQSFVNCTASFLRYFYDKIDKHTAFDYLHNKFRDEIFERLSICNHGEEFFYDPLVYKWIKMVVDYTAEETLFKAARAYGNENTTAILRFSAQNLQIPDGSRLAIVGAGFAARHYYAQFIINGKYDIPIWCEHTNPGGYSYISPMEKLYETDFDYVLIAFQNKKLIKETIDMLIKHGIQQDKIILGGNNNEIA